MASTLYNPTLASPEATHHYYFMGAGCVMQPAKSTDYWRKLITMDEEEALDFYKRITEGKTRYETISLEHTTGAMLEDVKMHPVDKTTLAGIIDKLPDEMFEAVEDAEDADEAEEELEDAGGSLNAVTAETVEAFETLCKESLTHEGLTKPQMHHIVDELNFETLFELGTEIINMSSEQTGAVRGFRKQG